MAEGVYAVSNLVSNADKPVLSLASNWKGTAAELVVNARVAVSPDELETLVRSTLADEALAAIATVDIDRFSASDPGDQSQHTD